MTQNQQNRSSSGHGAGRDTRDAAGRNRQAASPKAATRIAPAGGMAAMALAFLAAFLLAPGAARADIDQCGSLSGAADDPPHTATCDDTHAPGNDGLFTGGIYYTGNNPVNVIVQGSTAATVTSGNNGGWWSAIVVTTGTHASEDRSIDLDVGTTGNVAIVQSSNTNAITWYHHRGILVHQHAGGGSTIDVDVSSRVTIGQPEGTGMGPMSAIGIEAALNSAEARNDDNGAGAITIDSGATIYADLHGIYLINEGPGASTVGHTGAIVAATTSSYALAGQTTAGIFVLDSGASGAVTVTSSGDITAGTFTASCSSGGHTAQAACEAASHTWYADGAQANGIFAGTTGKDAAGDDHGVSVTHRAGDIMAGGIGIEAHVGAERDESNTDVGSCSAGGHMTRTDCEGVSETWTATYVMPENEGLVEVAVEGGTIRSKARAINAINYEAGSVEVDVSGGVTLTSTEAAGIWAEVADVGNMSGTVTVNNAGTINAAADDQAGIVALRPAGTGAISVTHSGGTIMAGAQGIRARYGTAAADNGRIHVTVAAGTTVTGATDGIFVENAGEGLQIPKMYAPKAIRDLAAAAGADDLIAMGGLNAAGDTIETPYRNQLVTVEGTVTGGTGAAVHLSGGGAVIVMKGGEVLAGSSGVAIKVNDPGPAHLYIDGEVKGGNAPDSLSEEEQAAHAAVHLYGGSVIIGVNGKVEADGATSAIRGDSRAGEDDPPTRVVFQVAADGMTGGLRHVRDDGTVNREGWMAARERVVGSIVGAGIRGSGGGGVKLALADGEGATGVEMDADLDNQGSLVVPPTSPLAQCPMDQERNDAGMCVAMQTPPSEEPCPTGQKRNDAGMCVAVQTPPSEQQPQRTPQRTMNCGDASDDRCRLYEALPSALLAMNGVPTYEERMSAARDARGGWARVEAARGKWKADTSTRTDVAYDHSRSGLRAGMDFAAGDAGRVGVSVHGLRGSAEMAQAGGEIDLSGAGLGVHATTALGGGSYVDMQAAVTWYHADLKSMTGSTLKNDVNGRGYALGVEVGKRLAGMDGGVAVTPRAGLVWSKADLDDFQDARFATVSVKEAQSLKARAGVGVEKALDGDGMDGSRLFASLDVEQEFKEETEAVVLGTSLKASARKTRIRTAAGAVHVWDEGRYSLQGSLGYAAGGGGNRDFGGGLSFAMRF